MKNNFIQIFFVVIVIALLLLLTDSIMYFMPPLALVTVVFMVVIGLGAWAGFIIKEEAADEREAAHRMLSGRIAYLAGLAVLTVGLVVQGFQHSVDPWVAGALGAMVVSKLVARMYLNDRH
jgi:hypothetical protein